MVSPFNPGAAPTDSTFLTWPRIAARCPGKGVFSFSTSAREEKEEKSWMGLDLGGEISLTSVGGYLTPDISKILSQYKE